MTDWNNGQIHGWNGGDCPVHPETVVEYREYNEQFEVVTDKEGL